LRGPEDSHAAPYIYVGKVIFLYIYSFFLKKLLEASDFFQFL
jgi:hypothetical protein